MVSRRNGTSKNVRLSLEHGPSNEAQIAGGTGVLRDQLKLAARAILSVYTGSLKED